MKESIVQSESVVIHGRRFVQFIDREQLMQRTAELAAEISADLHTHNPIVIAVLNGAFIFAADLLRSMDFDPEVQFVKLSSYREMRSSGEIKQLLGIPDDLLRGRSVLIVEDIVDTGKTLRFLLEDLTRRGASEVIVATMLLKPHVFQDRFPVPYVGFEIPNTFVVGYGLDYEGYGRSLNGIYRLEEE
jgi:hypoxanthine phosphoribosyltransferase